MSWDSIENAEIYEEFVHDHELYRSLNEELVRHADLGAARRVLDVACGTGETTRAILAHVAPTAEVVGVDAAEAMIDVARTYNADPRARFVLGDATRLTQSVEAPFDRVLGNAAFWQFPNLEKVLAEISALTAPSAVLVFNVPFERIVGAPVEAHALQAALSRFLFRETQRPLPTPTQLLDSEWLVLQARKYGFRRRTEVDFSYACRQGELLELMEIPAMIGPLTVDLGAEAVRRVLSGVRAAVNLEERVEVRWRYFAFERFALEA